MESVLLFFGWLISKVGLILSILLVGLLPFYLYKFASSKGYIKNIWIGAASVILSAFIVFWMIAISSVMRSGI